MSADYRGPESPTSLGQTNCTTWSVYLDSLKSDATGGFTSWAHYFAEEERVQPFIEKEQLPMDVRP